MNIIKRTLHVLIRLIKLDKRLFLYKLISILLTNIFTIINLLLPKLILQIINTKSIDLLFKFVLVYLFVFLFLTLVNNYFTKEIEIHNEILNCKITDEFIKTSYGLKTSFFDYTENYNKYLLVFNHCTEIYQNTLNNIILLISSVIQIFLIMYIIKWVNFSIIIIIFTTTIIQYFINKSISTKIYKLQKNIVSEKKEINYIFRLFYIPDYLKDIRINNLKKYILNKKNNANLSLISKFSKVYKGIFKRTNAIQIISIFETVITTTYFAVSVIKDIIWFDDFIVAFNSYNQLKNAISSIMNSYVDIYKNDLFVKDYLDFINNKSYMEQNDDHQKKSLDIINSIEFKNVYFKYNSDQNYVIDNLSFRINKNETVAIIGPNGTGKTTIFKLLLGLYTPQTGEILINNCNISNYSLSSLRSNFGSLFQDSVLYSYSIIDNIQFDNNCDVQQLTDLSHQLNIYDKITSLPLSFNTPITNEIMANGVELSSGEKQKILLLRALCSDSNVLLLDEPSSNLDQNSTENLIKCLKKDVGHMKIILTHDKNFLKIANNVVDLGA